MRNHHRLFLVIAGFGLASCDSLSSVSLPSWMGGSKEKGPVIEGQRLSAVPAAERDLVSDESLAGVAVILPEPQTMIAGRAGHAALNPQLASWDSATIGEGEKWKHGLPPMPVAGEGLVFAMDGQGYISAHMAGEVRAVRWTSPALVPKDADPILGGGLTYSQGQLFAVSGRGTAAALHPTTGAEIWKQNLGVSVRSAPAAAQGKVFVLTMDNQLLALDASTGALLWRHRGISETAGFLTNPAPVVADNLVLIPYSSGELAVLQIEDGREAWSESLTLPRRTQATSIFTGISATPVVDEGLVYASGSSGVFMALDLRTGNRLWEHRFIAAEAPWVAGDFLFAVSAEGQLICLHKRDGRIKWVKSLTQEKEEKVMWRGPLVAGGRVWAVSSAGRLAAVAPESGEILEQRDIGDSLRTPPLVSEGALYLVDSDAELHSGR